MTNLKSLIRHVLVLLRNRSFINIIHIPAYFILRQIFIYIYSLGSLSVPVFISGYNPQMKRLETSDEASDALFENFEYVIAFYSRAVLRTSAFYCILFTMCPILFKPFFYYVHVLIPTMCSYSLTRPS